MHRVVQGLIASIPAIPYIMKRQQRTSIASWVLGGVGLAIAGGLIAVMLASPRTRRRAIGAARDTYGRMNEKVSHLRHRDHNEAPMSNGLVDRGEYPTTTGL